MIVTQAYTSDDKQAYTAEDDRELFLPPNFLKKALPETCSALIFVVVMWFLYEKDDSVPGYRA